LIYTEVFLWLILQIFYLPENFEIGDGIAPLHPPGYAPGCNRILIAGCRPAQEFVTERSPCAHRFGNSN